MRLPFGLDLKTVIVTLLFYIFVIPFIMRFWAGRQTTKK